MLPSVLQFCAKLLLTMAFTFNFPDVNCGFRLEQKYWQINRFGEKKGTDRQIVHTPIHPPPSGDRKY